MEEKKYTMAELLAEEDERLKKEAELAEQRRLAEKEQKHLQYLAEKEQRHLQYLEEKERKHQEWLAEKERRANTFEDKMLTCKKCGKEFLFSASEQKFFKEKGFFRPSMCKECRANTKVINNFRKS